MTVHAIATNPSRASEHQQLAAPERHRQRQDGAAIMGMEAGEEK
ncbi:MULTISPECIES: hypothetical protein [Amycolatopsis]|nr:MULTISPECIES: hypothetical protein [Amycolatopsis]